MLKKRLPALVAGAIGVVAVVLAILVALHLARKESLLEQETRAELLAGEVLRRTDAASQQVLDAILQMERAQAADHCSDANIALMRRQAFVHDQIQSVGYIVDDRLMCSSFGRHGEGIPVGLPDYINRFGAHIRSAVVFPFAPGAEMLIATRQASGYAVMVHSGQPINVLVNDSLVSVGTYGAESGLLMMHRGKFDMSWPALLPRDQFETVRLVDDRIVALKRSRQFDFVAYASLPAGAVEQGGRQLALILVPLGILTGLVVALAVFVVLRQRLSMPALIRGALRWDEFHLVYQPVVDLRSGRWVGAEALIRWRRGGGEMVGPDQFIPIAEQNGLIGAITQRVLELAVRDTCSLLQHVPDLHIGVNFSASDLQSDSLAPRLEATLAKAGLQPSQLMIEATERGLFNTESTRRNLQALRQLGVRVAVDDFGTGYSNLSSLTALPLDFLKIDRSFVEAVGTDAPTSDVVQHIIQIAGTLKLELIAEGVETEAQAEFLRVRGVRYAQGWLFAPPMSIEDFKRQIQAQRQTGGDAESAAPDPT